MRSRVGGVTSDRPWHSPHVVSLAAAAWAFGHAVLSGYWAAGGTAGLGLLSEGIQEQALARDGWFVALVAAVAAGKAVAGVLVLALVRPWGRRLQMLLLLAVYLLGGAFVLYALGGLASGILFAAGVVGTTEPPDPAWRWYVTLWYPLWLLGGALFLLTARASRGVREASPADR